MQDLIHVTSIKCDGWDESHNDLTFMMVDAECTFDYYQIKDNKLHLVSSQEDSLGELEFYPISKEISVKAVAADGVTLIGYLIKLERGFVVDVEPIEL